MTFLSLDRVLGTHKHLTKDYKYQVFLDHFRFPYTQVWCKPSHKDMVSPALLVQGELKFILNALAVRAGDFQGFEDFAASVGTLVGMFTMIDGPTSSELRCGSYVDTLLIQLPAHFLVHQTLGNYPDWQCNALHSSRSSWVAQEKSPDPGEFLSYNRDMYIRMCTCQQSSQTAKSQSCYYSTWKPAGRLTL